MTSAFDSNDLRELVQRTVPAPPCKIDYKELMSRHRRRVRLRFATMLTVGAAVTGLALVPILALSSGPAGSRQELRTQVPKPVTTSSAQQAPATPADKPACTSSRLNLGHTKEGPGFGAEGTLSEYATTPIRNTGPSCIFAMPSQIRVFGGDGSSASVPVINTEHFGQREIRHGQTLYLTVGAWWPTPSTTGRHAGVRCDRPIANVTTFELPLGTGAARIPLRTAWTSVCREPATVSVGLRISG